VKVVPGETKDDEPQNEVKGYKPLEGAAAPAAAATDAAAPAAAAAATTQAAPTANAPAWARKAS
jgi:hypothetical protein